MICSGMGVRSIQKIRDGVLVLDCMSLSSILLHATAICSSPFGTAILTFLFVKMCVLAVYSTLSNALIIAGASDIY